MCEERGPVLIAPSFREGPVVIVTSLSERGRPRAQQIESLLDLFGLPSVLGETLGGEGISKGIKSRLEKAPFVVAIVSRDEKVDDGTWRASEWVMQELGYSDALEKDILILVEEGVKFNGGLLGDVEFLTFNADNFSDVLIPFGRQVRALLNRHLLTIGIKKMAIHTYVSDEPIENECKDEAKLLVLDVRHLSKQQRYEEALELALKATLIDPNCWRAWTSLGAVRVQLGKVNEGDQLFDQVLNDFSGNHKAKGAALHNRAWVQEIRYGLDPSASALRHLLCLFGKALKEDKSRVNTRACMVIYRYLLDDNNKAEKLLEDSLLYEGFLDALLLELEARGASVHKVIQALPACVRNILYPIRRNTSGGDY